MSTIEIQLCKEDRARLDQIIEGLANIQPHCDKCVKSASTAMHDVVETLTAKNEPKAEADAPVSPTTPQEEPKAQPQELVNPVEESATADAVEVEAPPQEEPKVTLAQISQKVLTLAAAAGGAKKAQVRAIISNYGTKVSDLKDQPEKWDEVWAKLTALESEA